MRPVGPEEEVICPSCRRYVGTFERCPYCWARVPKRLAFRLIKWGGLVVAVLGIVFLYIDLHGPRLIIQDPPTIEISEISPTMNFAQVYIRGKVTFARFYDDRRTLGMFITDLDNENASIFVQAYDSEAPKFIEMETRRLAENDPQPRFPAVGDIVTVRGQLRLRPDFNMMIIQYAEGLEIERPQATLTTIENLVENAAMFDEYQRFEIEGKIIAKSGLSWATSLTVYEMNSKAEISLLIPNLLIKFGPTLETEMGDMIIGRMIRVKGTFSTYYGSPQLWLASWDDLEVI